MAYKYYIRRDSCDTPFTLFRRRMTGHNFRKTIEVYKQDKSWHTAAWYDYEFEKYTKIYAHLIKEIPKDEFNKFKLILKMAK